MKKNQTIQKKSNGTAFPWFFGGSILPPTLFFGGLQEGMRFFGGDSTHARSKSGHAGNDLDRLPPRFRTKIPKVGVFPAPKRHALSSSAFEIPNSLVKFENRRSQPT